MLYSTDRPVSADQFRDLLLRSGLSERRPVDDLVCLQGMLDHADITATCWVDDRLVGISRSVTDFHYCCYLSDLAVDREFQSQGIGAALISLTQSLLQPRCKVILLAAPSARDYYPHIGFDQHPSAWVLPRDRALNVSNL
jgi:GNAT superfamily N-acetyltransferase